MYYEPIKQKEGLHTLPVNLWLSGLAHISRNIMYMYMYIIQYLRSHIEAYITHSYRSRMAQLVGNARIDLIFLS